MAVEAFDSIPNLLNYWEKLAAIDFRRFIVAVVLMDSSHIRECSFITFDSIIYCSRVTVHIIRFSVRFAIKNTNYSVFLLFPCAVFSVRLKNIRLRSAIVI